MLSTDELAALHHQIKKQLRQSANAAQIHDFNVVDVIAFGLPPSQEMPLKNDKLGRYEVVKTRGPRQKGVATAKQPVPQSVATQFGSAIFLCVLAIGICFGMNVFWAVACGIALGFALYRQLLSS